MHSPNRRQLIAAEVRAELARQKLSLRELAAATGYSFDIIRRRVAGEYPFDTDQLDAVSTALKIPIVRLIGNPTPPTATDPEQAA